MMNLCGFLQQSGQIVEERFNVLIQLQLDAVLAKRANEILCNKCR